MTMLLVYMHDTLRMAKIKFRLMLEYLADIMSDSERRKDRGQIYAA